MTRRKVVCVFGEFDDKSDFVLEPVCTCEDCDERGFWITDEVDKKDDNKKRSK